MAKEEYKHAKDLPIRAAVWQLLKGADDIMVCMDRDYKHTFGQGLVNDIRQMLKLVSRANRYSGIERLDAIRELLDVYDEVADTIKYCTERGYLGADGCKIYIFVIPLLANVERQASGWLKQTQANINA